MKTEYVSSLLRHDLVFPAFIVGGIVWFMIVIMFCALVRGGYKEEE